MPTLIRPARLQDAHTLANIFVDGWRFAYEGLLPRAFLASLDVCEREKQQKELIIRSARAADYRMRVADRDGVVVGVCTFGKCREKDSENTGEIYALYLNPNNVGQSIGFSLMQDALAQLSHEGFIQASLWVLDGNSRALSFYQKFGFILTGKTKRDEMFGIKLLEREMEISLI
ncbi:GNAT family N-acetyltransferase [Rothia terrae]|uniref:GNAT family N-acetyltransferase n=1 Tax=Rothia terrae TaxID=396015 RepID=UPI00144674A3|nr:GNAT family N-acetyltransferase [Rothia terrae]NKZ34653.1 GNAT family N-acetyltransferase [Rothia terrae]